MWFKGRLIILLYLPVLHFRELFPTFAHLSSLTTAFSKGVAIASSSLGVFIAAMAANYRQESIYCQSNVSASHAFCKTC